MNSMLIVVILAVANVADAGVPGRPALSQLRGSNEPVRVDETTVPGNKSTLQLHEYNGVHIQPPLKSQPATTSTIAPEASQPHKRKSRSMTDMLTDPFCVMCLTTLAKLPMCAICFLNESNRPKRSAPALTPLVEGMQVEPTRRPPPSLEPSLGEITQPKDTRKPKRLVIEECVGCRHHNRTTKHPLGERKPREVDVAKPVVSSSAPQNLSTPSLAVELVVQSTKSNDTSGPKRDMWELIDSLGFRKLDGVPYIEPRLG